MHLHPIASGRIVGTYEVLNSYIVSCRPFHANVIFTQARAIKTLQYESTAPRN